MIFLSYIDVLSFICLLLATYWLKFLYIYYTFDLRYILSLAISILSFYLWGLVQAWREKAKSWNSSEKKSGFLIKGYRS